MAATPPRSEDRNQITKLNGIGPSVDRPMFLSGGFAGLLAWRVVVGAAELRALLPVVFY
jgi:hypothetical protein